LTFTDTNVLIDVATNNRDWADWSRRALSAAHSRGALLINVVVYAEFAVSFARASDCDAELAPFDLTMAEIPREAAFRAAQAFREYRQAGGGRVAVLPDFFIGAHASVLKLPLLTRDARRYRTYFPELSLLAPERS
jgi:predicted nucleic acid-binding protein